MRSVIAIIAGSLFIAIVSLFIQLAFVFVAVGYNVLAKYYPFLNDISGFFRYLIGIPVFMVTMFFGGYITAYIANMKVLFHCLIVGLITAGGMLFLALERADITFTGMVIFTLALVTTMAGGLYWKRENKLADAVDTWR